MAGARHAQVTLIPHNQKHRIQWTGAAPNVSTNLVATALATPFCVSHAATVHLPGMFCPADISCGTPAAHTVLRALGGAIFVCRCLVPLFSRKRHCCLHAECKGRRAATSRQHIVASVATERSDSLGRTQSTLSQKQGFAPTPWSNEQRRLSRLRQRLRRTVKLINPSEATEGEGRTDGDAVKDNNAATAKTGPAASMPSSPPQRTTQLAMPSGADLPKKVARRTPNPHMVTDSYYDKVGSRRRLGGTNKSNVDESVAVNTPHHLLEGHRQSFKDWLSRGICKQIEECKSMATLSEDSVVIISDEELKERKSIVEKVPWSDSVFGSAAVRLGSLKENTGKKGAVMGPPRFGITLLPELLYFRAPQETFEDVRNRSGTWTFEIALPACVTDNLSGLTFDVTVELGSLPMMTDHGSFVIRGNPHTFVHRVCKMPKPRYMKKEKGVHVLVLGTFQYSSWRVCYHEDEHEPFLLLAGSIVKLPASLVLQAIGLTFEDLQSMRNFKEFYLERDDFDKTAACMKLCTMLQLNVKKENAEAALSCQFRLAWGALKTIGRRCYNERLGLNLTETRVTKFDVMAAVDLIIDVKSEVHQLEEDDIDSMENKVLRSVGDVMHETFDDWLHERITKTGSLAFVVDFSKGTAFPDNKGPSLIKFFNSMMWRENNRQMVDECNPLQEINQLRRMTHVDNEGLDAIKRIKGLRLIHPTQYGRACPIETGEGMAAGVVMSLASNARITTDGEIVAPQIRVDGARKQLSQAWEYLRAKDQNRCRVAQFDVAHRSDGSLCSRIQLQGCNDKDQKHMQWQEGDVKDQKQIDSITTVYLGSFKQTPIHRIEYIHPGPPISCAIGCIPFLEHDDATRALMGAKMQAQGVPTLWPERPIVGTGMEAHVATSSSWSKRASMNGHVLYTDGSVAVLVSSSVAEGAVKKAETKMWTSREPEKAPLPPPLPEGWVEKEFHVRTEIASEPLVDAAGTKKHTLIHHTNVTIPGESVARGEVVGEGSGMAGGELSVGKNLVTAYMPFEGYNYEDAILISKRCVREDILTSIHFETVSKEVEDASCTSQFLTDTAAYTTNGLIREGTWVEEDDILVGLKKTISSDKDVEEKVIDMSLTVPQGVRGRVTDCRMDKMRSTMFVVVTIAVTCRIGVGDKLSGRHGNKGIVAKIMDDRDMPYMPDGTPIDIVLNPLGVPSRMNVGQIFECLLGSAGRWTGKEYRVGPFDEMYGDEASRGIVFEALRKASDETGYQWLLDPRTPGKMRVFDGRNGRPFEQPVTVGISYICKLCHMVKDKIVARALGGHQGYTQVTLQPMKGRTRGGGQRLGEMEVSALVGYGAQATLQEFLTVKSDDVEGRSVANTAIESGNKVRLPDGGTPFGYRAFAKELAAAGLAITTETLGNSQVED